ncbi:hypothetical protein Tco_0945959 [Tanacetum coccineum]
MKDLQARTLKQEEAPASWIKSSTNMAWNLGSRMTAAFEGQPSSVPSGSVTPTLALTHIPANVEGENATNTATEEPPSHTEGILKTQQWQFQYHQFIPLKSNQLMINQSPRHEVIKLVQEEAEKIGLDPRKIASAKAGKKFKKAQDSEHEVLKREHSKKVKRLTELNRRRAEEYMWTMTNRIKPEPITDVRIHPNTKPIVASIFRINDKRNFDVHQPFKFSDFGITELDELVPKQASSQNSGRKRKHMELEPEVKVPGLECNRSLPEGVPFVNHMVIEELEYGIFFINVFGDQAFQRWDDIHKVGVDCLVSYLVMASMVKIKENARFSLKLRKMIADHPDQDKLKFKKVKLEALGYHAPGVVKPEIGGNVNFEIKSQFMPELREDTFFGHKNEDAHDHVDRVLNIIDSLQELSTLGTSLKKPLSKGIVHHPGPLNDLKTSITLSKKAMNRYTKLGNGIIQGPIPGMTPTQALTTIQTMADHSQKWHDGTLSRNVSSNNNTDGLAAIVSKLDNLGRDMKKLKENVHAIQVVCQIFKGPHLDKECPLNEEVKQLEEVKYGEFGRSAPFNGSNRAKFRVGPPGYYTHTNNRPPYGEKRPSLEELMNRHQEESTRRSIKMKEWTTNGTPSSSAGECKVVNNDHETQHRPISLNDKEEWTTKDIQCQFPAKELKPGNFTLPCTISNFNFYGMADLGASVNVMPRNTFEYLRLANLRNTNMLVEMADLTKKAPLGLS